VSSPEHENDAPRTGPAADEPVPVAEAVTVRRAPRFAAFIGAGALAGLIGGALGAALVRADDGSPRSAVIVLTATGLAAFGALVGAGIAAVADRRSVRRVADRG